MQIIYVDDEKIARDKFCFIVQRIDPQLNLKVFDDCGKVKSYAKEYHIDVAFLDIAMPEETGLQLALELREINPYTRIVFVTAYDAYALDAFQVAAVGYLLKPYTEEQVRKMLVRAGSITYQKKVGTPKLYIRTMPVFEVYINDELVVWRRLKVKEMLAFLIDRAGTSVTQGQLIAALWEDRPCDSNTKSLCRVTWQRLVEFMDSVGLGDLLISENGQRLVRRDMLQSDYQELIATGNTAKIPYDGRYMSEYSWGEVTNASLQKYLPKG